MSSSLADPEGTVPIGRTVRAPKTAEIIAANIRRRIVCGDLREGATLPAEAELMAHFGVSRPTLREAFRILETESLINIRPGFRGGARVIAPNISVAARYVGLLLQMSGTTIGEVYETRAIIEPAAARMLADRHEQRDLVDLRTCIADLRTLVEGAGERAGRTMTEWSEPAWRFHDLLVGRAGNRALAVQWGVLRDVTETHLASVINRSGNRPETLRTFRKSLRSYSKLVELVEAGDADGAERHWRTHMEVSAKILMAGERAQTVVDLFT